LGARDGLALLRLVLCHDLILGVVDLAKGPVARGIFSKIHYIKPEVFVLTVH
jgi:hypothetical protein